MGEFFDMLDSAGLLDSDPQQRAIGDLCREREADWAEQHLQPNGDRRVVLRRIDDETPVCRGLVTVAGRVSVDVTEVIA